VRGGLLRAALVNVLNPAPWTFWALVLGPLTVSAWGRGPLHGAAVVAAFYAALVGGGVALVAAFGAAARLGARVRTALQAVSTAALAGFAVLLAARALGV
jgi:threonine/homoserine/homoserine lactone efflux protein